MTKHSPNTFKTFVLIDDIKLVGGEVLGVDAIDVNSGVQVYPNPSETGIFEIKPNQSSL